MSENLIKQYKTTSGLTWREFADRMGVTLDTVFKWSADSRKPDLHNMVRFAELSGYPLDQVVLSFSRRVSPTARRSGRVGSRRGNRPAGGAE